MKLRTIDLSNKTTAQAKNIMIKLQKIAKKYPKSLPFRFILPSKPPVIKRNVFEPGKIKVRCPYCTSKLIQTEAGIICTSNKMRDIIHDIESTLRRHKDNPELYMSKKASRFYDYYKHMGKSLLCDYVQGNEERRFTINNRILVKGVDRNSIKKKKV